MHFFCRDWNHEDKLVNKIALNATFEERAKVVVEGDGSDSCVLSDSDLKEEAWDADEEKHQEIGDQECSTAVLETEVGKPPDIAETYKSQKKIFLN